MGVLCLSLFCYALLCVHSSFEIILRKNRKLFALLLLSYKWAATRENLSLGGGGGGCEQHRRRPACASAQSDQRLCYSLLGKHHM